MNTSVLPHTLAKIGTQFHSIPVQRLRESVSKVCTEITDRRNVFLHSAAGVGVAAGYITGDTNAGFCVWGVSSLAVMMPWFLMRFTEEGACKKEIKK